MSRVERWESRAEVPLLLLAVAFLVAYAWPILDPRIDREVASFLGLLSWTTWLAFAVDLLARLALAEQRGRYAMRHWYDLVLMLVPMLRPLRLLRLLAFARVLNRSAVGNLAGRVTIYVSGGAVAAVGLGALAVLDAERGADGANILSAGDALWWAATTVTTVGYGDYYPVTNTGRFAALGLMLVGIALVTSLTAAIATWMLASIRAQDQELR
ncbi:potassium channel family protein [Nocardioides lianchengensis]|uniref:Voltage-gated potassium channel n=1 Tax=Nocardioides lianchengensis TaxID=1045774 RepID=A0A1G6J469_9ACTN|nr:potassium channel family protein [Nocardioides lianchengensis]NYG12863.1 voltage-gated potassium channel [Nocardioides lianchengensis]SDC13409.1 voltage-gated potassium channel [Nocardioides lianchengensis]